MADAQAESQELQWIADSTLEDVYVAPRYVVEESGPYRASRRLLMDLVHTSLDVSFDWEKQRLNGLAKLTLKPYFYPQDSLVLDAKGFDVEYVRLYEDGGAQRDLAYTYDSLQMVIDLGKEYKRDEEFRLAIKYVAKPNELPEGGSHAISSDKGLYFINPTGKENKPRQIWTQGETEASSCWFPTIDSPNEKTTEEISITVADSLTTLSNGVLEWTKFNGDGTKTDHWAQSKPHAPYLFVMVVGEFAVVKDSWRGIPVEYYVEKEYEPYARDIFGRTPEMMEFFSQRLGYDYPWDKYSQAVVRDYVSGAMENTSAAIFLEQIQMTDRELLDKDWDYIVAHELFHHWFGDLVTCESWSNLPLNESFANYSEYLWFEHKVGTDYADYHGEKEQSEYLDEAERKRVPLIRYYYDDKEDMFDRHSYNKGGRVLHMLRKYVGDEAFFESLKRYLNKKEFQPAEIHDLRLSFEEVTGEDLNWFFNQWFLSAGHPELEVEHLYVDSLGVLQVSVYQAQDTVQNPIYRLPLDIAIWEGGKRRIESIVIDQSFQQFEFNVSGKPDVVVFDAEQQLLGTINHPKNIDELVFQYKNSPKYLARKHALEEMEEQALPSIMLLANQFEEDGSSSEDINRDSLRVLIYGVLDTCMREGFVSALDDPFWGIRAFALEELNGWELSDWEEVNEKAKQMALADKKADVRKAAIGYLSMVSSQWAEKDYKEIFKQGLKDSSYAVIGESLKGYAASGAEDVPEVLASFEATDKSGILMVLAEYFSVNADSTQYEWYVQTFDKLSFGDQIKFSTYMANYLERMPEAHQEEGIQFFEDVAGNEDLNKYTRFAGYRGLFELDELPGVRKKRREVIKAETDPTWIRIYQNWEASLSK